MRVDPPKTNSTSLFGVSRVRNSADRAATTAYGPDIQAQTVTISLGGRWHGRYGVAACPVCQTEQRSDQTALTIADGAKSILFHCKKMDCDFRSILSAVGEMPVVVVRPHSFVASRANSEGRVAAERKTELALRLWKEAVPIQQTIAETYMRGRGITCFLPHTLRFHPRAWHISGQDLPALVACVDGVDTFAVYRTYLSADCSGKANVEPRKAMLGSTSGGAVQLATARGPLVVAEGIETSLSLVSGPLPG